MMRGRRSALLACALLWSCSTPEPVVAFRTASPRRIVVLPAESVGAASPLLASFDQIAHSILVERGYLAVPAEVTASALNASIPREAALTYLLDTFAADAVMVQRVLPRSTLAGSDPRDSEIEWTIVAGRPPQPIWSSRLRMRSSVLTTDRVSGPPDIAGFDDPSSGAAGGRHSQLRALDSNESVEEVLARMAVRLPRAGSRD
ncbi:MAG: hypothetical protein AB7I19_13405 [Planctomycetota bacterium]